MCVYIYTCVCVFINRYIDTWLDSYVCIYIYT